MTSLLLDTSSLFYRAHHALPPMNTSTGEHTAALYGFSSLLLKLLREVRPTGLAFARDLPQPTFRHVEYTEYKAGRAPTPDALRTQWRRLDALIAATGAPSHAAAGFEADDVLATLATRLTAESDAGAVEPAPASVLVVSGDRDLFQVVTEKTKVLFMGARGQKPETVDPDLVMKRYGVPPEGLPMLFALVGESADNIIGVPGVGMKTAARLVTEHRTMSSLLGDLASVTPPKLQDSLAAASERLRKNDALTHLRHDVPLGDGPLVSPVTSASLTAVRALFEALEMKSLVARLDVLATKWPP